MQPHTAVISSPPPRYSRVNRSESAFTLIELSIVLVVIGLLVGGVLVGRDLIKAAEVRAQISQIEKYNTTANTFFGKYAGLPGDLQINLANQFGFTVPPDCTGLMGQRDGNGLIDGANGNYLAALMGENALFWMDLSKSNLLDATPTNPQGDNWGANYSGLCTFSVTGNASNFLPAGKLGYGTSIHVYETGKRNWFLLAPIGAFSGGTSSVASTPTIPISQVYAIDQKMDDGIPNLGNVQAVYINATQSGTSPAPNAAVDSATTCYNTASATAAYSITYNNGNGLNCALSFKMQAGD